MIFIAAGSNLPFSGLDSQQLVRNGHSALANLGRVISRTSLYCSPAWPDPSDPPFVNAVAAIETDLGPEALLAALHAIEAGAGRRRGTKNAPRTLDLDLIAYGDMIREPSGPPPVLPHPGIAERRFVLEPLYEIAPDWRHPVTGQTAAAMLAALPGAPLRRISSEK